MNNGYRIQSRLRAKTEQKGDGLILPANGKNQKQPEFGWIHGNLGPAQPRFSSRVRTTERLAGPVFCPQRELDDCREEEIHQLTLIPYYRQQQQVAVAVRRVRFPNNKKMAKHIRLLFHSSFFLFPLEICLK